MSHTDSRAVHLYLFKTVFPHIPIRTSQADFVAKTPTTTISFTLKMIWWRWLVCAFFLKKTFFHCQYHALTAAEDNAVYLRGSLISYN